MTSALLLCLAATAQAPASYSRDIADTVLAKCAGCHNTADRSSKLSLESVADMRVGGKRGPALVAGQADESHIYRFAAHLDKPFMPPPDKPQATPLTTDELALLKRWIDEGAVDDSAQSDASSYEAIGALPAKYAPILAVDISDDGRRVVAGHGDRVEVFDTDTGLRIHTYTGLRDLVQAVRFSPDGRWLAAGSYRDILLWTCPTVYEGKPLLGHKAAVRDACVLDGGSALVSAGSDKTLRFWDLSNGSVTRIVDLPSEADAVAVRPSDGLIAVGCGDGIVRLFDRGLKARGVLPGPDGSCARVEFRGGILAVSHEHSCSVWSVPMAPELAVARLYSLSEASGVFTLLDARAGAQLLLAGPDGTVAVHSLATGERLGTVTVDATQKPAVIRALLPDSRRGIVWAGLADGRVVALDTSSGIAFCTLSLHQGAIDSLALSSRGDRLLSVDDSGAVVCWDVATREPIVAFAHPPAKRGDPLAAVTAVRFVDGERFLTGSAQGDMRLWDVEGRWGDWRRMGGHADRVLALDFNPDGTLLAAGAGHPVRDGELSIWETGKGMLVRRLDGVHSDCIYGVRFSPDGQRLATGSADKFVKIFNVSNGREWRSLEGHTNHVLSVDWSADGRQLVSAGADNFIKFWDTEAGESTRSTQALDKQIASLRWPRGSGTPVVAAACGDKRVRFFNPSNTQVTRTFQGPEAFVFAVALSPDRSRVAAGDANGVLYIWNGTNAQLLHKISPVP